MSYDDSRHQIIGADENALDGRGLMIVAGLATAWALLGDAYGKTVWFDITWPAT